MARKRDVQQFRQACREAGLTRDERYEATKAFHAEKRSTGSRGDMAYGELVAWLREWKDAHGDD
ncbi:MAG: hypothetical protein WKF94_13010 [Solirubrobacteraceae bacterium]